MTRRQFGRHVTRRRFPLQAGGAMPQVFLVNPASLQGGIPSQYILQSPQVGHRHVTRACVCVCVLLQLVQEVQGSVTTVTQV